MVFVENRYFTGMFSHSTWPPPPHPPSPERLPCPLATESEPCVLRAICKIYLYCFRAAFGLYLDPLLAAFGVSKVVIPFETLLKNALSKQRFARTIPNGFLDGSYTSFDLQTAPKREPKTTTKASVVLTNTVNNAVSACFCNLEFLDHASH